MTSRVQGPSLMLQLSATPHNKPHLKVSESTCYWALGFNYAGGRKDGSFIFRYDVQINNARAAWLRERRSHLKCRAEASSDSRLFHVVLEMLWPYARFCA